MKNVILGTIGSGAIVHQFLTQALRSGMELAAVYSRTEARGRTIAEVFGGEIFTDLSAFLADERFNTVYIATPNSLHFQQAKQALLAGKHVICEKPFCTGLAEAKELATMAEERGLMLVEAMPTAYLPNLELIRENLPKIGQVKLVTANYSQYSSRYDLLLRGELTNIFDPKMAGGCLMDINYYNLYFTVALFGAPKAATYHCNRFDGKYDTSGILMLDYDSFVSQCSAAKDSWGENFVQIQGDGGYIHVAACSNGLGPVRIVTREGETVVNAQDDPERMSYEARTLCDLFRREDREALRRRMDTTLAAMTALELTKR